MNNQEWLNLFVGVIALSSVVMSVVVVVVGWHLLKVLKQLEQLMESLHKELNAFSVRMELIGHKISALLTHLDYERRALGEHVSHVLSDVRQTLGEVSSDVHGVIRAASGGIQKLTVGSMVIKTAMQWWQTRKKGKKQ